MCLGRGTQQVTPMARGADGEAREALSGTPEAKKAARLGLGSRRPGGWREQRGEGREAFFPAVAPGQGAPAVVEGQGRTQQPALLNARKLLTWRAPVDDRQRQGMPGPAGLLPRPAGI